jgi:hypothetical protein
MIKGHGRKILATIAHLHYSAPADKAGDLIDPLLEQLFGGTTNRSPLWFSDAVSLDKAKPHPQFFNAIDRFTGGVKDNALFNVIATDTQRLESVIEWEPERLPSGNWWKGLLVLLLRDAMDGQLAIGWGKSKGDGAIHLVLSRESDETLTNWEQTLALLLQHHVDETLIASWIEALHLEIKEMISEHGVELPASAPG